MDADMNRYDLNHVTTGHPRMSGKEWQQAYQTAWDTYFTATHVETVLKRASSGGISVGKMMFLLLWFYACASIERVHPLEGGYFRHKYRLDRRPGMPIENPFVFYPCRAAEVIRNHAGMLAMLWKFGRIRRRIKSDPDAMSYTDTALTPATEDGQEHLELLAN